MSDLFEVVRLYLRYGRNQTGTLGFLYRLLRINWFSKEVVFQWNPNLKWITSRKFQSSKIPYYYDIADREEFNFMDYILSDSDVLWDVGANVGIYSFWIASKKNIQCYLFEPDSESRIHGTRILELNELNKQIHYFNFAIGEDNSIGYLTFGLDMNNHISHFSDDSRTVPIKSLDHLNLPIPKLIKIDTEGYELNVLKGASNLLQDDRVRAIIIETDLHLKTAISEILSEYSYFPVRFDNGKVKSNLKMALTQSGNVLWLKK